MDPCYKKAKIISVNKTKPMLSYLVLKYVGLLLLIWPTDNNRKWFHRFVCEIFWWILMINDIFLFLGISIGFYNCFDEIPGITTMIFILIELTLICENVYTRVDFKVRNSQIKTLISILEKAVNNVNSKEEILLKAHIKKYDLITWIRWIVYHLIIFFVIYFNLSDPTTIFPKEIWYPWYPFPKDPLNQKYLLFIQQLIFMFHMGQLNIADGILCFSITLAAAKLEVLSDQFRNVVTNFELKKCIRQHQYIIWYAKQINNTMRFIILKTVLATSLYLIYGFVQVAQTGNKLGLPVTAEFIAFVTIANYRLFYTALCANALKSMSEDLRFSLLSIGISGKMCRSMCIIILRCHKPLHMSVSGIMPEFSLKYYGKFFYVTFSYFLTLKAILDLKFRY